MKRNTLKIKIVLLVTAFMMMFSGIAWCESLVQFQEKAIKNRKIVEKYRAELEKSIQDIRISRSSYSPRLDMNYTANSLDEDSQIENSDNSSFETVMSYNIFAGFRDKYNIKSAKLIKTSKKYELDSIIQSIKYNVAVKYLEIYKKKSNLKVTEDEYRLLKKRYKDTESRYHVGLIKKNDLLKIKVELDDSLQKVKKAEADFEKSINYIEYEVDEEIDRAMLKFDEFDSPPEVKDFESYKALMFDKKSEIKAIEAVVEAMKNTALSVKSNYYPFVDLSGSYTHFGENYILGAGGDETEDETRVQLSVKINLFDGFKKYASVNKARLDVKTVKYDLYDLKKNLTTELKNIILDYEVSVKNLQVAESSISQAEENLRITDASFKEGVETAADVLDSISYLSRARYNFINAQNERFLNYYSLVRLIDGF
ncbi:TolC family protein [Candidatus Magnetomoraceae bacterium gMMP-15]